jgi:hypothetical protein
MFESWYDSNAQETPRRSVPKLCATVGIETATILVAVPEKKVPNSAVARSKVLMRDSKRARFSDGEFLD